MSEESEFKCKYYPPKHCLNSYSNIPRDYCMCCLLGEMLDKMNDLEQSMNNVASNVENLGYKLDSLKDN